MTKGNSWELGEPPEPNTLGSGTADHWFARVFHNPRTAWGVLLTSLVLTGAAWFLSDRYVTQRAVDRFNFQSDDIRSAIEQRMLEYESMLRGGAGLFSANERVTRDAWKAYVSHLQIDKYFPGIQGIGYSEWIAPEDRENFERAVRAEGFPSFRVHPEGDRTVYSSILFLEPFDWRNQRAFGYDMFSESVRREAMIRACDSGLAAMSGKVTLVQETKEDVQPGFLMYLPIYTQGTTPLTAEERRQRLKGFVYSPFRMNDLLKGLLGSVMAELSFEIYDGETPSKEALLYRSEGWNVGAGEQAARVPKTATSLYSNRKLEIAGRNWLLAVLHSEKEIDASLPMMVGAGGVLIDLLLFAIIASISRQRHWAIAAAHQMTAQVRTLSTAVEQSPIKIVITNLQGDIEYVNPRFIEETGFDADEILGSNIRILQSGETAPETYRNLWNSILAGRPWRGELLNKRKNGTLYWDNVQISPIRSDSGTVGHFLGIQEDITQRKESADRLLSAFENVATGAVVIDRTGTIETFNTAASKIFGYAPSEVIGRDVSILMPEPFRSAHGTYIRKFLATGVAKIIGTGREVIGRRKNGQEFPMHIGIGKMQMGDRVSFIGSMIDLTETKSLQHQLQQSQRMEAIGQLTGGIAHDFNNLLSVIMGNLELLRDEDQTQEQLRRRLDRALRAVTQGATLTQQLLSFARAQTLRPEALDVIQSVSDLVKLFERTLGEPIQIVTDFPDQPLTIHVDHGMFSSALLNLAINARDAMPRGGELAIRVAPADLHGERTDHGGTPINGRFAAISFSDTGCGMSEIVLNRAMEPFFTTKEFGKGSGLGLSMVYGFVHQSKGHILITSKPGLGTMVTLLFPLSQDAVQNTERPTHVLLAEKTPLILFVEDNAEVRAVGADMLRKIGCEVVEAEDASGAIAHIQSMARPIQAVVSDIVMPGDLSGIEFAGWLRRHYPHIPIILASGYSDQNIINATADDIAALCSGTLRKPYSMSELIAALNHALTPDTSRDSLSSPSSGRPADA